MLAVDAGSHLASITRLLEKDFPRVSRPKPHPTESQPQVNGNTHNADDAALRAGSVSSISSSSSDESVVLRTLDSGPFAGLTLPHETSRANALHVVRECVSTYLITHPHLDHISAFAINTAAFHNTSRPKRLAAMPSTVNAIKAHIFNNVIWPNLTDEDGGVGFVTIQRLTEGGNLAVGEGSGKGYIEVCDGLCVKGMKISHGHCHCGVAGVYIPRVSEVGLSDASLPKHAAADGDTSPVKPQRTPSITQLSMPGTPGYNPASAAAPPAASFADHAHPHREVVVDSTAYFIRDDATGRELLIFGDVEPDSLSLSPRTAQVWAEAAPKIAAGVVRAILIECSYDDSQGDAVLFGHLAPRHLIKELGVLAEMVRHRKVELKGRRRSSKKRKRDGGETDGNDHAHAAPSSNDHDGLTHSVEMPTTTTDDEVAAKRGRRNSHIAEPSISISPKRLPTRHDPSPCPGSPDGLYISGDAHIPQVDGLLPRNSVSEHEREPPLAGLTVLVIHVKDTMKDGPLVSQNVLQQLREHEERLKDYDGVGLGCEFVISEVGRSYSF